MGEGRGVRCTINKAKRPLGTDDVSREFTVPLSLPLYTLVLLLPHSAGRTSHLSTYLLLFPFPLNIYWTFHFTRVPLHYTLDFGVTKRPPVGKVTL